MSERVSICGFSYARMVLEIKLGRELLPTEDCHHIDGNSLNDEPENLEAIDRTLHRSTHKIGNQNAFGNRAKTGQQTPEETKEKISKAMLGNLNGIGNKGGHGSLGNKSRAGVKQTEEEIRKRVETRRKNKFLRESVIVDKILGVK